MRLRRALVQQLAQRTASSGLTPGCSELHPVEAWNPTQSEIAQPPWLPVPLLQQNASFYLQPEPLVFQLVSLPLTLPPCTAVKSLAVSPLSPLVNGGDAVEHPRSHPFFQWNQPQHCRLSSQHKGPSNLLVASADFIPVNLYYSCLGNPKLDTISRCDTASTE